MFIWSQCVDCVKSLLLKNFYFRISGRNCLTLKEKLKIINVQAQEKLSVRKIAKKLTNKTFWKIGTYIPNWSLQSFSQDYWPSFSKPGFESQARHQNEIRKVFLRRFLLSRFLAKTRRVNKIAMKSFSKNLWFGVDFKL